MYLEQLPGFVATSRVCCLGGYREGMSSSEVFVWFEIESKCLIW